MLCLVLKNFRLQWVARSFKGSRGTQKCVKSELKPNVGWKEKWLCMIPLRLIPQVSPYSAGESKPSYYKLLEIDEYVELTPPPKSSLLCRHSAQFISLLGFRVDLSPTHIKVSLHPEIPRCLQCMLPGVSGISSLFLTKFLLAPIPDILQGICMPPVISFLEKKVFDKRCMSLECATTISPPPPNWSVY